MNAQLDLEFYPHRPGWKKRGTSRAAAHGVRSAANTLRMRALEIFERGPATADEIAKWLDETVLSIRPRISELAALNAIEDSGKRRMNASGRDAIVWRLRGRHAA